MSDFKPVSDAELARAYNFIDSNQTFRDDICHANALTEYEERQRALRSAEREGLRRAIDNVLRERAK